MLYFLCMGTLERKLALETLFEHFNETIIPKRLQFLDFSLMPTTPVYRILSYSGCVRNILYIFIFSVRMKV